jgi:hypothetical protein
VEVYLENVYRALTTAQQWTLPWWLPSVRCDSVFPLHFFHRFCVVRAILIKIFREMNTVYIFPAHNPPPQATAAVNNGLWIVHLAFPSKPSSKQSVLRASSKVCRLCEKAFVSCILAPDGDEHLKLFLSRIERTLLKKKIESSAFSKQLLFLFFQAPVWLVLQVQVLW